MGSYLFKNASDPDIYHVEFENEYKREPNITIKTRNVIWIDPNINNNENSKIQKLMKQNLSNDYEIKTYDKISNAIEEIKNIKFKKTFIILSAKLIEEFNTEINKIKTNIYIIPELIIFTSETSKKSIETKPPKLIFFNKNLVFCNHNNLITYLNVSENYHLNIDINSNNNDITNFSSFNDDNNFFIFEYITSINDLILPIRYSSFIWEPSKSEIDDFNKFLIKKYQNCYNELNLLMNQILTDYEVPIEILVKYWLRLYTFNEPKIYLIINEGLNEGNDQYDIFTRVSYSGLRLNGIKSLVNKPLYRGSKITLDEIKFIEEKINNKKKNKKIPECICYSKSFLSFSEDFTVGIKFLIEKKKYLQKNDRFCFFLINSGDEKKMISQLSNANIQDISRYKENEILFFPFSCFEINSIKQKKMKDLYNNEILNKNSKIKGQMESLLSIDKNEIYYEIILDYLGKYSEEIGKIKEKIPLTKFAENIFTTEIFNKKKLKDSDKFAFDISRFIKGSYNNFITANYNISEDDANKKIFIINGTKKNIDKIKNCEIMLSNKKIIKFQNQYKFKKGKYSFTFYFKEDLTNLNDLFKNCSTLYKLDFSNFKKNSIQEMSYMFFECNSLIEIYINDFKTENVTDMSHLFHKCSSLKKLSLSKFNTQKVNNMNHMFSDCSSLTELNLSNFNTINVKNMNGMFFKCESLTELNLSNFNTKNVTSMSWMFSNCSSLKNLKISNFNTNNVTDMSYMFNDCSSLTKLDLSNFSTINVTDMSSMFNGCSKMNSLNISSFNTDKTKYFQEIFKKLNPSCKVECKNKFLMTKIYC